MQKYPYDYTNTVIAWDFNYPEIDWTTWGTNKSEEHHSKKFIDVCRDVYLHQHTTQPTQHRHGQNESLLDLVSTRV